MKQGTLFYVMFYALSILAIHLISRKPYRYFFHAGFHDDLHIFRNRAQYDLFKLIHRLKKQEGFKKASGKTACGVPGELGGLL